MEAKREQNAKKETIAAAEAIDMARKVSEIRATKGRKVVRLAVKGATDQEIAALVVGPAATCAPRRCASGRRSWSASTRRCMRS